MKVGTLLLILHDVIEGLVGMNLLLSTGDFNSPTIQQDVAIASMVERCAKTHGVIVQADLDKILNILPLVVGLIH